MSDYVLKEYSLDKCGNGMIAQSKRMNSLAARNIDIVPAPAYRYDYLTKQDVLRKDMVKLLFVQKNKDGSVTELTDQVNHLPMCCMKGCFSGCGTFGPAYYGSLLKDSFANNEYVVTSDLSKKAYYKKILSEPPLNEKEYYRAIKNNPPAFLKEASAEDRDNIVSLARASILDNSDDDDLDRDSAASQLVKEVDESDYSKPFELKHANAVLNHLKPKKVDFGMQHSEFWQKVQTRAIEIILKICNEVKDNPDHEFAYLEIPQKLFYMVDSRRQLETLGKDFYYPTVKNEMNSEVPFDEPGSRVKIVKEQYMTGKDFSKGEKKSQTLVLPESLAPFDGDFKREKLVTRDLNITGKIVIKRKTKVPIKKRKRGSDEEEDDFETLDDMEAPEEFKIVETEECRIVKLNPAAQSVDSKELSRRCKVLTEAGCKGNALVNISYEDQRKGKNTFGIVFAEKRIKMLVPDNMNYNIVGTIPSNEESEGGSDEDKEVMDAMDDDF